MPTEPQEIDLKMDPAELYREEVITDRKAGAIRRMIPVNSDGTDDDSRAVLYMGQTQLLTPMGTLPLSFEIEAASLKEAIDKFPQAAQQAIEQAIEEAKELRRESASSIVTPESAPGMPGGGPGNMPGGGNIKLR